MYFNQPWMDLTGLTLAESLGDGWNPAFHPDERPLARRLWAEANRTGEPYDRVPAAAAALPRAGASYRVGPLRRAGRTGDQLGVGSRYRTFPACTRSSAHTVVRRDAASASGIDR